MEEIERGNIIESDDNNDEKGVTAGEISLPDNPQEQAIPELLEDGLDIVEFEDDDFLIEDIPMPASTSAGSKQPPIRETLRDRVEPVNGAVGSHANKSSSARSVRQRLSPVRRRSRSPRLPKAYSPQSRRSRSPRMRRSRSPRQRRSPSPRLRRSRSPRLKKGWGSPQHQRILTPPRSYSPSSQYRASHQLPNSDKLTRSPIVDRLKASTDHRNLEASHAGADSKEVDRLTVMKAQVVAVVSSSPPLTPNEQETLSKRKEKFSKSKISSTKKTVKLKKTKKKASITKRLGTKKAKVVKVKSKSPEIVETVSLETPPPQVKVELECVAISISQPATGEILKNADRGKFIRLLYMLSC